MSKQLSREERATRLAGLRATLHLLYQQLHDGADPPANYLRKNHMDTERMIRMLRTTGAVWGYRQALDLTHVQHTATI